MLLIKFFYSKFGLIPHKCIICLAFGDNINGGEHIMDENNKEQKNKVEQQEIKSNPNDKQSNNENNNKGKDNNGNESKKKKQQKERDAFFRFDKNKVKLHLKAISKKFTQKRSKKGFILLIFFCLILGAGYALFTIETEPPEDFREFGEPELGDYLTEEDYLPDQSEIGDIGEFEEEIEREEEIDLRESEMEDFLEDREIDESGAIEEGQEVKEESPATELDVPEDIEKESGEVSGVVTEPVRSSLQEEIMGENIDLLRPVAGEIVRRKGWFYHPIFQDWRYQNGIKIAGNSGDIIMAADSGTISSIEEDDYKGVVVTITHDNELQTVYGHLQTTSVSAGEVVGKGQEIGKIGETGITSKPGLYFELNYGEEPVDPVDFIE